MPLLTLPVLTGCDQGGAEGTTPEPVAEVVIGQPVATNVQDTLGAVGTIEANERIQIQPEAPGLIEEVHFEEGQWVRKGERLFSLDSGKEEAAVAQARAEEDLARSNLERARTLVGTRAISLQEVDQLASQLAVSSARLKVEEENLADRVISAPFDGMAGPRLVSPGQYVNAGTPLGTLVDDSTVKVSCRIPERSLAFVRTGQVARLKVNTWPDETFSARVDLIEPEIDEATRTAGVRLVAGNPDRHLKPGMFARVDLVVAVRTNALVIPEGALVASLDEFSVYAVTGDVARLKPVRLGVRLPGEVEIRDGLDADSRLVLSGTQKVIMDGMKVKHAGTDDPASAPPSP